MHFTHYSLIKEEINRPKYNKLLQHPFITTSENEIVDVAAYVSHIMDEMANNGISVFTTDQPWNTTNCPHLLQIDSRQDDAHIPYFNNLCRQFVKYILCRKHNENNVCTVWVFQVSLYFNRDTLDLNVLSNVSRRIWKD